MPPKTFTKKKYAKSKKTYKSKSRFTRKRVSKPSWNPNMVTSVTVKGLSRPDRLNVKLPYEETCSSLAGATHATYSYNLNSLFDPNRTGVGHQPMGFDTWAAIYNRYIVHGVGYDITFVNNSTTSIAYVGMVASNDPTAPSSGTALEQARSINDLVTTNTSSKATKHFKGYFKCNQITGVPTAKYNNDDGYAAVVSASPTESILLHLFAQDVGLASNVTIIARVRLVYYATFFDPNPLAAS